MEPSSLEAHVGFWLRFVSNHVSGRFQRAIEAEGVSVSEWVALRHLHGAPATPAALIEALGMTKGAISKVIDRLETKGLARRTPAPDDGRAHRVELTRAGRVLVPRLATIADANDAHFFDGLASADRATLVRILRQIVVDQKLTTLPTD